MPVGKLRDGRAMLIFKQRIDQRLTFKNTNHRRTQLAVVLIRISNSRDRQRGCIRLDAVLELEFSPTQESCPPSRRAASAPRSSGEMGANNGVFSSIAAMNRLKADFFFTDRLPDHWAAFA
jgi:hypothetical protein